MYVGLMSVLIGITLGTFLGIFSAYVGGIVDLVVQRIVDALMAFPAIILALALMAALGPSRNNVVMALVVILVPGATRVIRSQVLSIKELDYTLAARAIGAGGSRIMFRHILPNVMAVYIVLLTITLGYAIVVEAALSFLGVGIPPDIASWGGMLNLGASRDIDIAPWLAIFPGVWPRPLAKAAAIRFSTVAGSGLPSSGEPSRRSMRPLGARPQRSTLVGFVTNSLPEDSR